jgi:WD40 repeat protein
VARLEGHQKRVSSMAFSAAGTRILTASEDGTARIWSAITGKELYALRSSAGGFLMAKWSPDDQRVVTVSNRGGVDLWYPRQAKHIAQLDGGTRFSSAVWFSADGTRLATAPFPKVSSTDYPVRIWNAGSGALVSELKGHGDMIRSIVFSPNGQRVLTASANKTAKIWDSGAGESLAALDCDGRVESAQFNGDGTRILIQSLDADSKRVTSLWNADSGQRIVHLAGTDSIGALAKFTADGAYMLISAGRFSGGDTSLWDSKTGKRLAVLRGSKRSEDSREIQYGIELQNPDKDNTAEIRTLDGSTLVLKGHTDRITNGHFSPNDKLAVTASKDGTARLWDAGSGSSKAILNGHRGAVHDAVFSADGQLLITAGEDGTARIWDVSSGAELIVLKGHRSVVRSASISVDDSRAVTIGEDHTIRQWDVKNGAQLSVSAIDDGMFENVVGRRGSAEAPRIAVTPDGTRVLAQGREELFVIRTFPSTKALLDETMRESARCLSHEERKTAYLEEEPPAWCIEQGKWPYDTLRWKAWLDAKRAGENPAYPVAGQQVAAGAHEAFQAGHFEEAMNLQGVLADTFSRATTSVPGGEPATAAGAFAHLSRYALFSKDYAKALSAAQRALELEGEKFLLMGTPDINAFMNKAHALMFLGRADEFPGATPQDARPQNRYGWR